MSQSLPLHARPVNLRADALSDRFSLDAIRESAPDVSDEDGMFTMLAARARQRRLTTRGDTAIVRGVEVQELVTLVGPAFDLMARIANACDGMCVKFHRDDAGQVDGVVLCRVVA